MRRVYWVMNRVDLKVLEEQLNSVAGDGWEVVSILPNVTYAMFVALVLTKEMSFGDYGDLVERRDRARQGPPAPKRDAGWEG